MNVPNIIRFPRAFFDNFHNFLVGLRRVCAPNWACLASLIKTADRPA
jgi:hypothetical protein